MMPLGTECLIYTLILIDTPIICRFELIRKIIIDSNIRKFEERNVGVF